jgi:hypothetical protein
MPRGDRTSPAGMGPMTGRAAGFCAGWGIPGFANNVPGRGLGMGYGRGRRFLGGGFGRGGYGRGIYPYPFDSESERRVLKNQADALQSELEFIKKRLSEIESAASDS